MSYRSRFAETHHKTALFLVMACLAVMGSAFTLHAQTTWDWDFGDASAHSAEQNPTHEYASPGPYHWVMMATVSSVQCLKEGDVVISYECTDCPAITQITSKTSKPKASATIYGTGFSTDKKKDVVYFGTKKAKISKATATSLKVKIPKVGAGIVQVYVIANGKESNKVDFTIK